MTIGETQKLLSEVTKAVLESVHDPKAKISFSQETLNDLADKVLTKKAKAEATAAGITLGKKLIYVLKGSGNKTNGDMKYTVNTVFRRTIVTARQGITEKKA